MARYVCIFINSLFATFADLHVRKLATFADLHSYTHAYCSFILLNEAIKIVSGSHCPHAFILIWLFAYDLQLKRNSELKIVLPKWHPKFSALQNVAHRGFVRGKQRVKHESCTCIAARKAETVKRPREDRYKSLNRSLTTCAIGSVHVFWWVTGSSDYFPSRAKR